MRIRKRSRQQWTDNRELLASTRVMLTVYHNTTLLHLPWMTILRFMMKNGPNIRKEWMAAEGDQYVGSYMGTLHAK